ncbi:Uncharacterised protein [Vibrio cholerae]|nr:Uncharacterised protein [Vibrio cholerae]CSI39467.1 Uncharacterised protein [Vibrio cholerae]CSI52931.1 Uncharacterised protein [Vibrio cholerae]
MFGTNTMAVTQTPCASASAIKTGFLGIKTLCVEYDRCTNVRQHATSGIDSLSTASVTPRKCASNWFSWLELWMVDCIISSYIVQRTCALKGNMPSRTLEIK